MQTGFAADEVAVSASKREDVIALTHRRSSPRRSRKASWSQLRKLKSTCAKPLKNPPTKIKPSATRIERVKPLNLTDSPPAPLSTFRNYRERRFLTTDGRN
jgi:hypothetical protein